MVRATSGVFGLPWVKFHFSTGNAIALVKEKVWKGSETVDHVACKYWCALPGSGVHQNHHKFD